MDPLTLDSKEKEPFLVTRVRFKAKVWEKESNSRSPLHQAMFTPVRHQSKGNKFQKSKQKIEKPSIIESTEIICFGGHQNDLRSTKTTTSTSFWLDRLRLLFISARLRRRRRSPTNSWTAAVEAPGDEKLHLGNSIAEVLLKSKIRATRGFWMKKHPKL